jgi:hypothetical protein
MSYSEGAKQDAGFLQNIHQWHSLIAIPATQIHSSTIQNIEYEGRGQSNHQMTQNGKTENGSLPLIKDFDFGTGSSFNESWQGFPTTTAKERRGSMLESMSMHS